MVIELFSIEEIHYFILTMAAARFSSDVLEMFYGPITQEENTRLRPPLRTSRDFDFNSERNNFNE